MFRPISLLSRGTTTTSRPFIISRRGMAGGGHGHGEQKKYEGKLE
jgi:hypothetical protein